MTASLPANFKVSPHPSEGFWFAFVLVASIIIWVLLIMTVIGFVYALAIGLFLLFAQAVFITHIRGSAVRLSPQQLPQLYQRVAALAEKLRMKRMPEVYLSQSNGVVNAMATRFFYTNFMILNSDIVEACGDNLDALDFVVGHELGHLKRRHLHWWWFLAPGRILPFFGHAYSRARELSCDRYGYALSNNKPRALEGLCILAAGAKHAREVNRQVFVNQIESMNGFWMKVGKWLSNYPPLAGRLAAIDESITKPRTNKIFGTVLAGAFVILFYAAIIGVIWGYVAIISMGIQEGQRAAAAARARQAAGATQAPPPAGAGQPLQFQLPQEPVQPSPQLTQPPQPLEQKN